MDKTQYAFRLKQPFSKVYPNPMYLGVKDGRATDVPNIDEAVVVEAPNTQKAWRKLKHMFPTSAHHHYEIRRYFEVSLPTTGNTKGTNDHR